MALTAVPTRISSLQTSFQYLVLLVALMKVPGFSLLPAPGLLLGVLLAPVIVRAVRREPIVQLLLGAALVATASGLLTVAYTPVTSGSPGEPFVQATLIAWIFSIPVTVALIMWASAGVPTRTAVVLVLIGGLVSALVNEPLAWKGSIGIFSTLLALALVWGRPLIVPRIILVSSAALSAIGDARFMTLIALLAVVATFIGRRTRDRLARNPVRWSIVITGAALVATRLAITAMQSGLLGPAIALRTQHQFVAGRSWIEAARTEWAASLHLFSAQPSGFGIGEVTNGGLAREAIARVQAVGGDYTADYFVVDVFGSRVDLHSMTADLWYHFGIGGLLVVLVTAAYLLVALPASISRARTGGVLVVFACLAGAWDLMFSPMGNVDRLIVALALAGTMLQQSRGPHGDAGSESGLAQAPTSSAVSSPRNDRRVQR
ncbi:hypothetical protein DEI99_002425 [Curtobacterium sp. MCLR17_036]|uniref:hypothetical protein n=1 Tax=Curtobacterium sp. MCLR17_036 TaxID=2175620 RepID=UPI000DA80E95|nr:hypothetical protein [Curtobacterium sp. MCLR17_036]WIE65409.1 hypothetical protein DEI99_002425 [Curtobacterium sp. MCLR17_036]